MMVETILESSQDFGAGAGMAGGALPQWKRELLQRRAARARAPAHPAHPALPAPPPLPPPPPPPPDEDEELRYGPGIVKRLKSRYLSLALRDAPRRRASVLRRAASLEHLLDERPPPAPAPRAPGRAPRPASLAPGAVPPLASRRDSVKRARSVDALSRLDSREDPCPPSPPPPPPSAPRQPQPRSARPPRRPTPLLRDTERPPPDVVRSALRKFESAPTRRPAPAARVSAVLRGLEQPRTSTPEPRDGGDVPPLQSPRTPSPGPRPPAEPAPPPPGGVDEPEGADSRLVSRAALDGIARAGSSVRYAFEAPPAGSHLPPLAAANPVLLGRARRIGVIRPMPARVCDDAPDAAARKSPEPSTAPASPRAAPPTEIEQPTPARTERKDPPPAALVEPIPRSPPEPAASTPSPTLADRVPSPEPKKPEPKPEVIAPLVNGHTVTDCPVEVKSVVSKIGAAGIERAWSGSKQRGAAEPSAAPWATGAGGAAPWETGAGGAAPRRARAPPPASTSIVFNFSNRKEVPDYIENDGIILRNKKNRTKPGEPGVVVLRPEALVRSDSESDSEAECGPPSPCRLKFVNDNVLINGKSSMPAAHNRDRIAKLKLQFDDSLTRTFEYPSEMSLCEESPPAPAGELPAGEPPASEPPAPQLAESPLMAQLAANTHITSAALSSYTPSKTRADVFQLGITRHHDYETQAEKSEEKESCPNGEEGVDVDGGEGVDEGEGEGGSRACGADAARSWSEARTHHTDLLF